MRVLTHLVLWHLGIARAQTQTTSAERDCLARWAAGRRRLVEIGVWHGVTTRRLLEAMHPDGTLYAVDPFPRGRLGFSAHRYIAQREVGRSGRDCVQWIRTTGATAGRAHAAARREPVDFIFIDGDHSYEGLRGDWQAWSDQVGPGGVVALHDSRSTPGRPIDEAGSVRYTNEVILKDRRYQIAETVETLTVLRFRST